MPTVYEQQESGYRFFDENKEHLHSLDSRPLLGTTTVTDVLGKGGLTWWASGKACEKFGWIARNKDADGKITWKEKDRLEKRMEEVVKAAEVGHAIVKSMTTEEYVDLLDAAYRAHKTNLDDSAEKGTDLHAQIEKYIHSQINKTPLLFEDPRIKPFIEWSKKNVRRFLWAEKCHYSRRLWTGGKSDWGYEDLDYRKILSDAKSAKEVYLSHLLQAGSYDIQIAENGIFKDTGDRVFPPFQVDGYAVFTFGGGFKEPTIITDTKPFKDGFEYALGLYRIKKFFEGE